MYVVHITGTPADPSVYLWNGDAPVPGAPARANMVHITSVANEQAFLKAGAKSVEVDQEQFAAMSEAAAPPPVA